MHREEITPARQRANMQSVPIGAPLEMIAMDFVGPLPCTERGNKYVLVVGDYFSKWAEAYPLPDQKGETVVRVLLSEFVCRYGIPTIIHSDQGRNFESNVMKGLCSMLGIEKSRTTAYHPQSDGLVERLNRTLMGAVSKYVERDQRDWDLWLPFVLFSYRTTVHASTAMTPYELMFGRLPKVSLDVRV